MTTSQSASHTCLMPELLRVAMTELLRVALRAIGVVLPGAALWGFVEVTPGVPSGDFGTFLGAMLLSLLTAAVWSAIDASRAPTGRVLIRWVTIVVVVGGGLGIESTLSAPGGPPSQRTSEMVWTSLFYCVPLLVAVGLGVAIGMAEAASNDRSRRRYEDTGGTAFWPLEVDRGHDAAFYRDGGDSSCCPRAKIPRAAGRGRANSRCWPRRSRSRHRD